MPGKKKSNAGNVLKRALLNLIRANCSVENVNSKKKYKYQNNKDKYNEAQRRKYEEDDEYSKKQSTHTMEGKHMFSCSACNCFLSQAHYQVDFESNKNSINLSTI